MSLENIFSDTVLKSLVEACPQDQEALAKVPGLSQKKLDDFGHQILALCTRPGITRKRALDTTDEDADGASPKKSFAEVPLPECIDPSQLTPEQHRWASAAFAGESLFITGEAGTGKSFMLAYIVQELQRTKTVAMTATTGIVAASLGGVTLHSFAGIGLGKGRDEEIISRVMMARDAVARWQETEVLVIDEISMLDGSVFQLLENLARRARGVEKPFGGLQLLLCGDFLQLPPVETTSFVFETEAWRKLSPITAELQQVLRQHGDDAFLAILREVRIGICSPSSTKALANCCVDKKPMPLDGIVPTRLYCVNKDVDAENAVRLKQLDSPILEVHAQDQWKENSSEANMSRLLDLIEKKAPAVLRLKIKAQVVLTKNIPGLGVMNGTRGVIEAWAAKKDGMQCPLVRCDNGNLVQIDPAAFSQSSVGGTGQLTRVQLPLKLGWALTVHRAQGCTLSRAELQLENAFDYGQAYVALSRVKSLNGLWIRGKPVTQREVKAHSKVLHFYYSGA
jgi:ATP-dependent DNA helicase PIF1